MSQLTELKAGKLIMARIFQMQALTTFCCNTNCMQKHDGSKSKNTANK